MEGSPRFGGPIPFVSQFLDPFVSQFFEGPQNVKNPGVAKPFSAPIHGSRLLRGVTILEGGGGSHNRRKGGAAKVNSDIAETVGPS